MLRSGSVLLAVSLLAGCGGVEAEQSSESFFAERQHTPLTTTDVDVVMTHTFWSE